MFQEIDGQARANQLDSIPETQRLKKRQHKLPLPLVIPTLKWAFVLLEQFFHVRVFDAVFSKDLPPSFGPFAPDLFFSQNARQR
jgi:hypothetical protein